jgi:hypothetical protein
MSIQWAKAPGDGIGKFILVLKVLKLRPASEKGRGEQRGRDCALGFDFESCDLVSHGLRWIFWQFR